MGLKVDIALDRPDFTLNAQFDAPAGVTVIFGPSGAGKSTLLQAVAGLATPQKGCIGHEDQTWFDHAAGLNRPPNKREVGYVFQEGRLFPHLTVKRNLIYGQRFRKTGMAMDQVVDLLGLEPLWARLPHQLSGGQAQRVALGRALLSGPKVLCLDEPLAALDGALKARILPYLEKVTRDAKIPILYITHDVGELTRLADHLVLLDQGQVTAKGNVHDLSATPSIAARFGAGQAGVVIEATTGPQEGGLQQVDCTGFALRLPDLGLPPGQHLRLRVAADNVMLSTVRPSGLSALNVIEGVVSDVFDQNEGGVLVQVKVGQSHLLSQITQVSFKRMNLTAGLPIFAIVKATALGVG
ncbi:MAG: molybdenum ABC transporter ATP-binding protein [Planktomarina sp.]